MIILFLAIIGALVVTAILTGARVALGGRSSCVPRELVSGIISLFVFNLALDLFILYWAMPPLTGPYGGWQWLIWPMLLSGALSLGFGGVLAGQRLISSIGTRASRFGRGRIIEPDPPSWRGIMAEGAGAAGVVAIVLALFIGLIANSLISIATTWFDPNAKALAAIPNVTMMPTDAKLPPTNVDHIVLVTQGNAAFKGKQVLAQNGKNLGSTYHLVDDEYTLQSVKDHLYWIAPLVYNNLFANLLNYNTPGYVVVDAENPDAQPQLRVDGYHLRYVPDALFNQDLVRHVYLSGYTNGDLLDPTLEVNDDWQPFFTVSLMQPSRGFTGEKLVKVLLVDPQSGAITEYDPAQVPTWVDRILPENVVSDYMGWWGLYHNAPWFNPSGTGQQQVAGDPLLVYNDVDQPVWLVPMTSGSAKDSSSTGIVLFNTKSNSAQFYPLTGLGVGESVRTTLAGNPNNIRQYDVSSIQLYTIYGEPTWVGLFTHSTDQGQTFQAVGIINAHTLAGADVQMQPSLDLALSSYAQWLATHNTISGTGQGSTTGKKAFSGKVLRVAPVTVSGSTVFYLWVEGQSHIFTASATLSPLLPLVQPGDTITGEYLETNTQVVTLTSFSDSAITLGP